MNNQAKANGVRVRELIKQIKSDPIFKTSSVKILQTKIKTIETLLELWYFDGLYSVPPLSVQVKEPILNFTSVVVSAQMIYQWGDEYTGWIHIDSETEKCYLLGANWAEVVELLVGEGLAIYVESSKD